MSKFHIQKLSKAQQNKLMSGSSVRISKGEIPMIVHPSRIKEITRKFKKGVGHSLSLSPEELHHNLNMEGGGPLGDMAKRVVKTGIRYAAPIGKTMARTAIGTGSAMLAAAQPELIPFIPAGAMALTAASDHLFDNAGRYADKFIPTDDDKHDASDYGRFDHPSVENIQNQVLNDHRFVQASNPYHGLNQFMGTNHGFQQDAGFGEARSGLLHSFNQAHVAKVRQKLPDKHAHKFAKSHLAHHDTRVRGGGFSNKIEKGSISIGGNLVQHYGQVHQALVSQPFAVNFSSRNFVNPAFASLIR